MILKTIEAGGDFKTNNYLVIDENSKEAVLIDCTGNFEEVSLLLKEYEANLKYILLTHGHFDHIGGCDEFKKKTKAKLFVNKNDQYLLDNIKIQCGYFNMPVFEKPEPDEFITEETKLNLGGHGIKVFETKGHTPGGMSYLIGDMLFSGDTLFFEEVGRCDLPGGNFDEIGKSIKDIVNVCVRNLVHNYMTNALSLEGLKELIEKLNETLSIKLNAKDFTKLSSKKELEDKLTEEITKNMKTGNIQAIKRNALRLYDIRIKGFLDSTDDIFDNVKLRVYAQKNVDIEYVKVAHEIFDEARVDLFTTILQRI